MKNKIIYGITAIALLSACSNDDVIDVKTANNAIGFNTFVDNVTRNSVTKDNLQNFYVYGYSKTGAEDYKTIFSNENVSKNDNAWSYDNTQYWVSGNTYQFHAIACATVSSTTSTTDNGDGTSTVTTTETVTDTRADRVTWTVDDSRETGTIKFNMNEGDDDLIYSHDNETTVPDDYTVPFTFNHLLSQVKFRFNNNFSSSEQIDVTNVTIQDAASEGTISVGNGKSTTSDGASAWVVSDDNFKKVINYGDINNGDWIQQDNSGESVAKMIIPTGTDKQYKATFTITVHTYTASDVDDEATENTYTYEQTNVILPAVTMLPGNSYVYVVSVNATSTNLNPIDFSIDVVEYKNPTNWTISSTNATAGDTTSNSEVGNNAELET